MKLSTSAGLGLITLGIGLNIPFAILGATFGYPDILRQPTAEVLTRFHAGGTPLIATLVCIHGGGAAARAGGSAGA